MSAKDRWNDPYRRKADPRATLTRNRVRLLEVEGVQSVGLGFDEAHRTVIVLGVAKDAPRAQTLPEEIDGVPVEIREVGKLAKTGDDEKGGAGPDAG